MASKVAGKQICPKCGKSNDDNWPLEIKGKIVLGGCQVCWEADCAEAWWQAHIFCCELALGKVNNGE